MSTHYIYEGKEYATLAETRRAVNKSFPKNPDTAMLLLLNIKTVERPDPVPQEPTEEEKAAAALEQAKQERASTVEKIKVTIDGMVFDGDEVSQGAWHERWRLLLPRALISKRRSACGCSPTALLRK